MRLILFKKIILLYYMSKKKPPDKKETINENIYMIINCPLKTVLKQYDILQPIINNVCYDINDLTILTYQFIKLYFIHLYNNNKELPYIDKQFVLDVFKVIGFSNDNRGKQSNIKNKEIKDDIKKYYDDVFIKLNNQKISYSNITTCIETNIKTHFFKHLFKYINCLFKIPKATEIKKETDKEKRKLMYRELNEEIRNLKNDIVNRKIETCKEEYHKWINDNINLILPENFTKSIPYDIKVNPIKYIKYSMYINDQIEKLKFKPYAFLPQRNNIIPKSILLNTSGITDLICSKYEKLFNYKKSELILNCKKHQSHIWSKILKLEKRNIFNKNKYVFYNQITTNGFSCSLLFILKKYKDKKFGDKLPKVKEEDNEFIKIESLTKEECDKYLTDKYELVSLDPGRKRILSMINKDGKFYKYSACRRRYETYTKRSNYIINQEKQKNNIIEKETELSKLKSKTLNEEEYKKFIVGKTKLNNETKEFYRRILFRKINFRRYVKTKQSEHKLLNDIENKFLSKEEIKNGKQILILYGDWSRDSQMKGTMPVPNKGFKKKLLSKFPSVDVNEFNTSKLYNKTFKEMENVKVKKGKHTISLHEILTPKEKTEKCIVINRDKNACKNILYLGKFYLEHQTRPEEFCRKIKNVVKEKKPRTKKQIAV